jgi:short-subunit dehydrogenase involved in D-alanine esterification of teichoic acids
MQATGNTVLITGGGSGIGLALAGELAKRGNRVVIAARSAQRLEAAAHKGYAVLPGDVSDPGSITSLARKVLDSFPTLNVVIHNAGIMKEREPAGDEYGRDCNRDHRNQSGGPHPPHHGAAATSSEAGPGYDHDGFLRPRIGAARAAEF